jgi:hypothetical protein
MIRETPTSPAGADAAAVEPEPAAEAAFEPEPEDRIWAIENLDLPASVPTTRIVHPRRETGVRDEDVLVATGCVG